MEKMTAVPFSVLDHLVVQTYVVHRGREPEPSHYEIHLAHEAHAPRAVYLTTDVALYEQALALEGTHNSIDAAWRPGRRRDGRTAQLLVALRPHEVAA